MTATAVEAAASRPARGIKGMIESSLAYAILLAAAVWLIANFVNAGGQSSSALVDGINNGALYALIALGYTQGTDFKLASRLPASQLVHWDAW